MVNKLELISGGLRLRKNNVVQLPFGKRKREIANIPPQEKSLKTCTTKLQKSLTPEAPLQQSKEHLKRFVIVTGAFFPTDCFIGLHCSAVAVGYEN